jgi:hypothetical protein
MNISKLLGKFLKTAVAVSSLSLGGSAFAAFTLTFEGLQNNEAIQNFYNGGTGSLGSSGTNYGVFFSPDALALIDSDAGGTGNFGHEPSADTAMYFLTNTAVLNVAAGFDTGFSFFYTAVFNPSAVNVYSGLNKTGSLLATINLPITPQDGGDPNGNFSPFVPIGVLFAGVAQSIDFGGTANQVAFDNITFGSATPPSGNGSPVPEPSTYGLVGALVLIGIAGARRLTRTASAA